MTDDIRHRLNDLHDAVTLAIPPLEFIANAFAVNSDWTGQEIGGAGQIIEKIVADLKDALAEADKPCEVTP